MPARCASVCEMLKNALPPRVINLTVLTTAWSACRPPEKALFAPKRPSFILWPCNHEEKGGILDAMKALCLD